MPVSSQQSSRNDFHRFKKTVTIIQIKSNEEFKLQIKGNAKKPIQFKSGWNVGGVMFFH